MQAKKVDVAGENQDALGLECPEPDVVLHEVLVPFAPVPLHLRTKINETAEVRQKWSVTFPLNKKGNKILTVFLTGLLCMESVWWK